MNYDKGYFDSSEFRELLARYEKSARLGIGSYFGIDEFVDLLSYYLSVDKSDEAAGVLDASVRLHPTAPENIKMEIKLQLYNGEPGPKPKSKWGSALLKYGFYLFYPLHRAVLALIFR